MLDLLAIQKEVISNRKRRRMVSAHDLSRTSLGLLEESGEFERARKTGNMPGMIDALVDVIVFCLGGLEIIGANANIELPKVIEHNKIRDHIGTH